MNIKKTYSVSDTVWIYGVARSANRITKGKIVHNFNLEGQDSTQYVISIPTSIEPLLEIRTWDTISQDSQGPVGALREMIAEQEMDAATKKMSQAGYEYDPSYESPEPTPDEIHAALERSQKAIEHAPLVLKENKPKSNNRRYPSRKKPQ